MDYWLFELEQWVMTPDGYRAIITQKVDKDIDHLNNRYFVEVPKLGGVARVFNEGELKACGAPRKVIKNQLEKIGELTFMQPEIYKIVNETLALL
jgi:hypothetical protein